MSDDKLLDDAVTLDQDFHPVSVGAGIRFANYLIDVIVLVVVLITLNFVLVDPTGLIGYGIVFGYYTILEGATGKTLGKMVTGCKVVNEYGDQPDFGTAALRSIIRYIPFLDALSIFFGDDGRMWHDQWSKTYVVKSSEY